jgi:hypothetical protein
MSKPTGIEWLDSSFVVGTREDLAPTPLPHRVFTHQCSHCGAQALTESEYPHDIPVVCNVCAAEVTKQIEQDSTTQLLFNLPAHVKAQLVDLAFQKRLPVEAVVKDFVDWKLGRATKASLQTKPEKKGKK